MNKKLTNIFSYGTNSLSQILVIGIQNINFLLPFDTHGIFPLQGGYISIIFTFTS